MGKSATPLFIRSVTVVGLRIAIALWISSPVPAQTVPKTSEKPTAPSWRTLKTNQFVIQYPSFGTADLTNPNHSDPPEVRISFAEQFSQGQDAGTDRFSFVIVCHPNRERKSLEAWVSGRWHDDAVLSRRTERVGGSPALAFTLMSVGDSENYVLVADSDRLFELRFPADLHDLPENVQHRYKDVFS